MGRLPTFLIIGAGKAGTTSLSTYLSSHPDVFMHPAKELYFFTNRYDEGVDWYRRQFRDAAGKLAVGEATPQYLTDPRAPPRMAAVVPSARLVAILRDPVDRAWSHYWHLRRGAIERRSFEQAIADERAGVSIPDHGYLSVGRYIDHLMRVTAHFPRPSLHVVLSEDLRDRSAEAYADVCRFIGTDDSFRPEDLGRIHNAGFRLRFPRLNRFVIWNPRVQRRLPRSVVLRMVSINRRLNRMPDVPRLSPTTRELLSGYFAPYNDALATWLGRDLPWNV